MMNSTQLSKLCEASIKHTNSPYEEFAWPDQIGKSEVCFSTELLSLYGTSFFDQLSEDQKIKLAFFECVNFFSLNIHGEKPLIQGLASRLYRDDEKNDYTEYLHHFLDEENDHMVYFGTFCRKYAGKIYRDKKIVFPREYLEGEEDFLFFLKIMVFEEIVDFYNVKMSKDVQLAPIVREINRRHHVDEVRHLIFGRAMVKSLFETYSNQWGENHLNELRNYIPHYIIATWKEYFNPEVYEDAGLENAYDISEAAFNSKAASKRRVEVTNGCLNFLLENKILITRPELNIQN